MKIRPKSTEVLKAQYAEYGESVGTDEVFDNLATHALHIVAATSDKKTNQAHEDYVGYLRARTTEDREKVAKSADILARYTEFAQPIKGLLESENKTLIGEGDHASVYLLTVDDKKYAVRVSRRMNNKLVQRHVSASVLVQDLPGFERVVAASYEDRIVVAEFVEGKHATELSPEVAAAIPDSHIDRFVAGKVEASKRGVGFDPHVQNVFYSDKDGFTDIDFGIQGKEVDTVGAMHIAIDSFFPGGMNGVDESQKQALSAMRSRMTKYAMEHLTADERSRLLEAMRKQTATNQMFDMFRPQR